MDHFFIITATSVLSKSINLKIKGHMKGMVSLLLKPPTIWPNILFGCQLLDWFAEKPFWHLFGFYFYIVKSYEHLNANLNKK